MDNALDIYRRWNGRFQLCNYGEFNRPVLGHQAEKCRHLNCETYDDVLVKRYENTVGNIEGF